MLNSTNLNLVIWLLLLRQNAISTNQWSTPSLNEWPRTMAKTIATTTGVIKVSRVLPRLRTQAAYFEDVEFASQKQNFPFDHSCNIMSNIDSECFCRNIFSFATNKIALGRKRCFWKISKTFFCFQDVDFVPST